MKRSWLIGAALVFSLTAIGCNDDEDEDKVTTTKDGGGVDSGVKSDGGLGGIDAGRTDAGASDAGGRDGG